MQHENTTAPENTTSDSIAIIVHDPKTNAEIRIELTPDRAEKLIHHIKQRNKIS